MHLPDESLQTGVDVSHNLLQEARRSYSALAASPLLLVLGLVESHTLGDLVPVGGSQCWLGHFCRLLSLLHCVLKERLRYVIECQLNILAVEG